MTPHHPTSSILHSYPSPSTTLPTPIKVLIIHIWPSSTVFYFIGCSVGRSGNWMIVQEVWQHSPPFFQDNLSIISKDPWRCLGWHSPQHCEAEGNLMTEYVFSKSVLDIRTRLVTTVEPETKWMPNSDSASKLMHHWKILGQYNLPNYCCSCLRIAVFWDVYVASPCKNEPGGKSFQQICFHMESPCNSWNNTLCKIWAV